MQRTDFNRDWTLKHGISSIMETVFGDHSLREKVTLPHDAMICAPRSAREASGPAMAYFQGENLEYVKSFYVPSSEKERVHYLDFDGVYTNASFFLNGEFVRQNPNGYVPCVFRADSYLKYEAENTIKVVLRNAAQPSARWYSGSGIYRNVSLLSGELLHIAPNGIRVTTIDCDDLLGVLEIEVQVRNADAEAKDAYAAVEISDENRKTVARGSVKFHVDAAGGVNVRQRIQVEDPQLWSASSPVMYQCRCSLCTEAEVDSAVVEFGIRKLQLDSKRGFRINGQPIKLKGGCLHNDNGPLGAISVYDAECRRIQLLKQAGYNAVRTAHNPPSEAFLTACDRAGMLVMHEYSDVWSESKSPFDYGAFMPQNWERDA